MKNKRIEKPVKVFLCAVLGMPIAALLGSPNSITVAVTALLVVGTGQASSRRGVLLYAARRVLIQILGALLLLAPILWLSRFPLPSWAVVLLACPIPLILLFCLDYRFSISPMYITSVGVSTLILATGLVQTTAYPLTRILLVSVGGLLGLFLSLVFFPRSHRADAEAGLGKALTCLEGCLRAAQAGQVQAARRLLRQGGALLAGTQSSIATMAEKEPALPPLRARADSLHALGRLLRLSLSSPDGPPEAGGGGDGLALAGRVLAYHRALAEGRTPAPEWDGGTGDALERFLLGELAEDRAADPATAP